LTKGKAEEKRRMFREKGEKKGKRLNFTMNRKEKKKKSGGKKKALASLPQEKKEEKASDSGDGGT